MRTKTTYVPSIYCCKVCAFVKVAIPTADRTFEMDCKAETIGCSDFCRTRKVRVCGCSPWYGVILAMSGQSGYQD